MSLLAPRTRPTVARGTRYPWARTWGPLSDRRSKISRLAIRIERELFETYDVARSPRAARLVRQAAAYEALAYVTLRTLGADPRATPRRATALERAAAGCIAQLEALGVRREKTVPTITELLARHQANGGQEG